MCAEKGGEDLEALRMVDQDVAAPWVAGHRKRVILGTDRADAINH